jgi:hypothetical protein
MILLDAHPGTHLELDRCQVGGPESQRAVAPSSRTPQDIICLVQPRHPNINKVISDIFLHVYKFRTSG